ncbi:MAG: hypothetical protein HY906_16195, partial [Deltaproteobacteria bacterium]|nr:hypothetical protein [Deltaproteobacteria bacterium]
MKPVRLRDVALLCLPIMLAACSGPKATPQADAGARRQADGGPPKAQTGPPLDIKPEVAPPPSGVLPPGDPQRRLEGAADQHFQRKPGKRIYIQVDKPIYQPGETVWVRTAAVRSATLTGADGESGILYQLVSPKGSVVIEKRIKAIGGYGFNDFELPDSIQGGEYTIKVKTDDGVDEKRTFVVSAYEAPRFKKTLEFLKKAYGVGDTVAATVEVKRPTGEAFGHRELTALLTLDGAELPRVKFRTDEKGSAVARVKLPAAIDKGDGILTILVDDAGVTESITKRVPIILNKLKLSFYPEGGDLVAGLPSRIYFAAQNLIDKPADIEGRVVDDRGATMATFASVRDGLGRFALTPASGRIYNVEITRPAGIVEKFQLPAAVERGCVLRTYDDLLGKEPTIRAAVHCTEARTVVVVAVLREQRLGSATAKAEPGRPAVVHLPLSRPDAMGVARVTVLSDTLEPLAERIVFRNWNRGLRVTVKPDKQSYTPRGQVVLDVETRDLDGRPVAAELALAAVDDTVVSVADDKTAHLNARLMLEAEVPGKVEEPNWYFKDDKQEAPLGLELLLGTRGWRKFEWQQVLSPPPDVVTGLAGLGAIGGAGGVGFA